MKLPDLAAVLILGNALFCGGCASDRIASFGARLSDNTSGRTASVSEQWGPDETRQLADWLNSPALALALAKYNCGDPAPKMVFRVTLCRRTEDGERRVEVLYTPELSPVGRTRGMDFGLGYLIDKTVARLDPTKAYTLTYIKPWGEKFTVTVDRRLREPHLDCSKRDTNEEWVTFPGPDEYPQP